MTLKARSVLADCEHAWAMLETEVRPETFRLLWVAGITLARAVGHVLEKVDGVQTVAAKSAIDAAYVSWKNDRRGNAIFWEFIEQERNQVLKQYEMGFFTGPISLLAANELFAADNFLFCPVTDGAFAGEDCRDVLKQAIEWWQLQLAKIEADIH
ncbi:MAG: hypothetical protein PSY14_12950 [bacterium]|nr:hypothetical protein [bacterium]